MKKYRLSLGFFTIFLFVFLYTFTSIPFYIGLKKTPNIKLSEAILDVNDEIDIKKEGAIGILSDKNLELFNPGHEYMLFFVATDKPNFTYQDIHCREKKCANIIIITGDVYFEKQIGKLYSYRIMFNIKGALSEIKEPIYCKVFFVQMFAPVHETNEICIPVERLLLSIRKTKIESNVPCDKILNNNSKGHESPIIIGGINRETTSIVAHLTYISIK
ncbi:hypothetical protein [Bacteroides sp. 224]|uniref:hypothetical protein n=1 Tax=Bacteroides sp. 224 TaxID=2302936 RepID=UPI0013D0C871|nr:hypothetical protein [Bacteroides sp. 224]